MVEGGEGFAFMALVLVLQADMWQQGYLARLLRALPAYAKHLASLVGNRRAGAVEHGSRRQPSEAAVLRWPCAGV